MHRIERAPDHDFGAPASVDRMLRIALAVGAFFVVASAVGGMRSPDQFFQSYLLAFLYVVAVPAGCLALSMLHHVTGGAWGLMIRRVLEAAARTLPFVGLLMIPLLLGARHVYVWAQPDAVAHDALLQHKAPYLNLAFFAVRAAVFFGVLGLISFLLDRWSSRQDETGDPQLVRRMKMLSAPGLGVWCLLSTFAGFDWLMSLDPHWYSSLYGVYFLGSMVLAGLAFAIVVAARLSREEPLLGCFRRQHFHDYGNLLLAFVMLWGYFSFSQFLIIWSGNLPEEVPWYLERIGGGWKLLTQFLVLFHFAVPFLLLITHAVKGRPPRLALVAGLVLFMRLVDLFWQSAPALHHHSVHWLDISLPVGLGGLWLAAFFWQLRRRRLLPVRAPQLGEALGNG